MGVFEKEEWVAWGFFENVRVVITRVCWAAENALIWIGSEKVGSVTSGGFKVVHLRFKSQR